jgi:hypothetical protein
MPAGRAPRDRDPVRITAVFGDVLLRPCDRVLDVDDVVGPGGAWAEPVVDCHAHPAQLGQMAHQRVRLSAFVSGHPGAARNLQQHGRPSAAVKVGPSPDVEMVARAALPVTDVAVVRVIAVDP